MGIREKAVTHKIMVQDSKARARLLKGTMMKRVGVRVLPCATSPAFSSLCVKIFVMLMHKKLGGLPQLSQAN